MNFILIDTEEQRQLILNFDPTIDNFCEFLFCDSVEIIIKSIGGKEYFIIVDDEALLKENKIISVLNKKYKPLYVGNVLIGCIGKDNKITGLENNFDYDNIYKHIAVAHTNKRDYVVLIVDK